ncbi:hypothetical protein [Fodinibius sp.]|uniref:hypothetical protein n=1 Tax=Fodinibius sp. TaxID=1872440 RepID=UPI002ACDE8DF|nr:hypothetical protein [Fodinibius sp.]MDZ7660568.1 hypothetical protein [Fodinibius sp.]
MIDINTSRAKQYLAEDEFSRAYEQAEKAFKTVQQGSGEGSEWLGWRGLLADPNDAILEQIDSLAAAIREQADVFIVCGIGGILFRGSRRY